MKPVEYVIDIKESGISHSQDERYKSKSLKSYVH